VTRPTHTIERKVITTQYFFDVDKMSDDPEQFMVEVKELFRVAHLVVWDDGSDRFKPLHHLYADDSDDSVPLDHKL